MKARWFAFLMIPAALALGFAQDADAGGYGHKSGHYGHSPSYGYKYGGYRKYGHAPAYRHYNGGHYKPGYRSGHRGYRHGYRKGYRHGYRSTYPAYRHGYYKGRKHGYSRSYYRPYAYRGGITLHFGY